MAGNSGGGAWLQCAGEAPITYLVSAVFATSDTIHPHLTWTTRKIFTQLQRKCQLWRTPRLSENALGLLHFGERASFARSDSVTGNLNSEKLISKIKILVCHV